MLAVMYRRASGSNSSLLIATTPASPRLSHKSATALYPLPRRVGHGITKQGTPYILAACTYAAQLVSPDHRLAVLSQLAFSRFSHQLDVGLAIAEFRGRFLSGEGVPKHEWTRLSVLLRRQPTTGGVRAYPWLKEVDCLKANINMEKDWVSRPMV